MYMAIHAYNVRSVNPESQDLSLNVDMFMLAAPPLRVARHTSLIINNDCALHY